MYRIFAFNPYSGKTAAFDGKAFDTLSDVQTDLAHIIVDFEIDADHDAADFFTTTGQVYSVERSD
jgi:hypothetical protein